MRVLLMANNWGGWQVSQWLREHGEEFVGLVIHPPENRKFTDRILSSAQLPNHRVIDAAELRNPKTVAFIRSLRPDIIVSSFFAYIIKPELIQIPPMGCVNLHPSYLPYNRGWHPNVWPILDGTPAGVTLHYIDEGVDTGDIIAQKIVEVEPTDTGGTLHQRLTRELVELFKDTWPRIKAGTNCRISQEASKATLHKRIDMDSLEHIDLDKSYLGRDLINLLRGRTYPPYPAAYFVHNGRRVYVRAELFYEEGLASESCTPHWD